MRYLAALFMFLSGMQSYGRMIAYYYPDDLAKMSNLVCDGEVTDVKMIADGRTQLFSARVKVSAVYKGEKSLSELDARYFWLRPARTMQEMVFDGPVQFNLDKGDKCRFYLVSDPVNSCYWPCLVHRVDDGQSVQPIPTTAQEHRFAQGELDRDYERWESERFQPGMYNNREMKLKELLGFYIRADPLRADVNTGKWTAGFVDNALLRRLVDLDKHEFSDAGDQYKSIIDGVVTDQTMKDRLWKQLVAYYSKSGQPDRYATDYLAGLLNNQEASPVPK